MSEHFTNIAGNASLRNRLAAEILTGRFPHACIFEGPGGSGKKTLALTVAAALSCERSGSGLPCFECLACRKIFSGKTPDVIRVTAEKDRVSVGVDTVRFLRRDVLTVPVDFEYKIYIVEDAGRMTVQAQNALLLTLEEPPKHALFFLICESALGMLETVRSRAPVFRTEPLTPEVIFDYIVSNDKRAAALAQSAPDELSELIGASCGRIGVALGLLDPKERGQALEKRRIAKQFVGMFGSGTSPASGKLEVISDFPQKREDTVAELATIQDALRDLIVLKKSENAPLIFWTDREAALDLSCKFTLSGLFSLVGKVDTAVRLLGRNANIRLTLLNLIAPPA